MSRFYHCDCSLNIVQGLRSRNRLNLLTARQSLNLILIVTMVPITTTAIIIIMVPTITTAITIINVLQNVANVTRLPFCNLYDRKLGVELVHYGLTDLLLPPFSN